MAAVITTPEDLSAEQVASMTAPQMKAEVSIRYDRLAEIERKYPDGPIGDAADATEAERLLSSLDVLEQRLRPIERDEERKRRVQDGVSRYSRNGRHSHPESDAGFQSPGLQFIEAAQYKHLSDSGIFRSAQNRFDLTVPLKGALLDHRKALVWSGTGVGGSLVQNDVLPGVKVPLLTRPTTLLDLIATTPTTSDTVEYVAEASFVNAAAPVPEATATTGTSGTKPESTITYTPVLSPVRQIAHWIPVTNRMLADVPGIRGLIDARLLLGLNLALEAQIITGDGTGENLLGILNTPGVNVQAKGTDSNIDAIFKGMQQVRITGLTEPTAVVLNPADFGAIRLARENSATGTLGGYLMGPPNLTGATTLWGVPTILSLGVPAGTALVGDFSPMGCMLWDREEGQVRVGWIDQQFIRNIVTLLAELRAAFTVFRGAAFSKVTGLT